MSKSSPKIEEKESKNLLSLTPLIDTFLIESKLTSAKFFTNPEFAKAYDIHSFISLLLLQLKIEAIEISVSNLQSIQAELIEYLQKIIEQSLEDFVKSFERYILTMLRGPPKLSCVPDTSYSFDGFQKPVISDIEKLISVLSRPIAAETKLATFTPRDIPLDPSEILLWSLETKKQPNRKNDWHQKLYLQCLGMQFFNAIASQTEQELLIEEKNWQSVLKIFNVARHFAKFIKNSRDAFVQYPVNDQKNWHKPITSFLTALETMMNFSFFPSDKSHEDYISKLFQNPKNVAVLDDDPFNELACVPEHKKSKKNICVLDDDRYINFINFIPEFFNGFFLILQQQIDLLTWPASALSNENFDQLTPWTLKRYHNELLEETIKIFTNDIKDYLLLPREEQYLRRGIYCVVMQPEGPLTELEGPVGSLFYKNIILMHAEQKSFSLSCLLAKPIYKVCQFRVYAYQRLVEEGECILIIDKGFSLNVMARMHCSNDVAVFALTSCDPVPESKILAKIDALPEGRIGLEHGDILEAIYSACQNRIETGYDGRSDYEFVTASIEDSETCAMIQDHKQQGFVTDELLLKKIKTLAETYQGLKLPDFRFQWYLPEIEVETVTPLRRLSLVTHTSSSSSAGSSSSVDNSSTSSSVAKLY
ncbi:MAG: hypothetical protein JSR33_06785 [Proteobacteria bacterium]|nr:hypothetical protein [Pseudomonadota bacterium]